MKINIDKSYFEQLVLLALDQLPAKIWYEIQNLEVVVEEEPSPELLSKMKIKPSNTLFGIYQGVPRNKRGINYANVLPDKITLFKKPIENLCQNRIQLIERIKEVVLHEIGHYFGFSEQELQEYLKK